MLKVIDLSKVIFKVISLEDNINIIKDFYSIEDKNLIDYFDIDINSNNINKEIEVKVSKKYNENINNMNNSMNIFNNIWNKYNNLYFSELTKYLNVDFDRNIECYIGVFTIFPRYLNSFNFCISYNLDEKKLIEVCAHEILHFVWFKKFKELYPDINEIEYDNPYLAWEYSELVVDFILNSKDINNILKINAKSYDYFYELNCFNKIREIYLSNNSIENKIRLGYEYLKKEGIK